jgi:poly-beta-1,6-N-acetyl-D-glucosamine biosynthesis protein PgaD
MTNITEKQPKPPLPSRGTDAFGQPLVYEKLHAISPFRRIVECGIGLLGAGLWVYGGWIVYRQLVRADGLGKSPAFISAAFGVIFGVYLLFLLWNRYNIWKFRGHERRRPRGETTAEEMGRPFHLAAAEVERLQQARAVRVEFTGQTITLTPDGQADATIKGRYSQRELAAAPQSHIAPHPPPPQTPAPPA